MTRGRAATLALLAVIFASCAAHRMEAASPRPARARNVILFIGDGMGMDIYTATRVWKSGVSGRLAIDTLPNTAVCSTYSYDNIVTDSAPSATSILSGVKSRNDVVGEGADAIPGRISDPESGTEGTAAKSILEIAAERGLATGVVTTTTVTHATPASAYAHIHHRDLEEIIATQLVVPRFGNPPDVVLGGGRQFFLPSSAADPEYPELRGARSDGRDLTAELSALGYAYAWNGDQFDALAPGASTRVLGLFEPSHLSFESRRELAAIDDPSLARMTAAAIDILSRDPEGYFLLVEGGRIDHALHVNNVELAVQEAAMFDEAVRTALDRTDPLDTLIIVTADHSHPLTLGGEPRVGRLPDGSEDVQATRGNLMGSGGVDIHGREYPALAFGSGPGALEPRPPLADRPALVPLQYSTHAGEDVFVAARGPGAERVRGFITNTDVFSIMRDAYGW